MSRRPSRLALLVLAAITLAVSYALPTVTFQQWGKSEQTYSIWGGIVSLWNDGNYVLAPTVFLFSMIFPIGKLIALWIVETGELGTRRRQRVEGWLHLLGKWSMLDVCIVGVFVASVQLGVAKSTSRVGIHVFSLAILLSMMNSWWVAGRSRPVRQSALDDLRSPLGRVLSLLRVASFVAVMLLPLLKVKKSVFGNVGPSNEVHLGRSTLDLAQGGEFLLALVIGSFVILIPAIRAACSLRLRWIPGDGSWSLRLARRLDGWTMVDVFGFGLLIVQVKLAELTETHLMAGFYATLVAAVVSQLEGFELRRRSNA